MKIRKSNFTAKTTLAVQIYGSEYELSANAEPEYIRQLAEEVDLRMRAMAQKFPHYTRYKIAILTLLEMADELRSIQSTLSQQEAQIEARLQQMEMFMEKLLA
ncbi:MAG: cell division protein ZapA [Acidobacteriota bacterium]|nr:cell division protein ZapA [Blastocatellia bacterium]MDW8411714.1 cell division protein ZapA [Acidobacteriota bacterium]